MNMVDYKDLLDFFEYSNLEERYKVLDRVFDIKEGNIIIDGGSLHGDMAIYFSRRLGNSGLVIAFEPLISNVVKLNSVIKIFKAPFISIKPFALWNKRKLLKMYHSEYENSCSLMKDFHKISNKNKFTYVIGESLDNIVKRFNIKRVDFIWMNIEGAETQALKGMKNTLKDNNCKLCISTHILDKKSTTDKIIKLLKKYGYKGSRIETHNTWVYAEKI